MRESALAWNCFWFKPGAPANLGFLRFVFFGLTLTIFWNHSVRHWGELPDVFWQPIVLFRTLGLPVLQSSNLAVLETVWKGALCLSALGLFTRLSICTSFLLGLYLLGLPQNFGKTHHYDAVIVITMGILAFARCADAWSLDRLIRSNRGPAAGERRIASGEFTWPIRLVWALMALVFLGAGVSKARYGGFEWVNSSNLAYTLAFHYYTHELPTALGLWIARHDWLCRSFAAATVVLEIAAPAAVFSATLRAFIVPSLFAMQSSIWLATGVLFLPFLPCYIFWIPWDRLAVRLAGVAAGAREQYARAGHPYS